MPDTTETRDVTPFDRIELKYAGNLVITQGTQEAVSLEGDAELLGKIRTEVRDGTLIIARTGDWLERILGDIKLLGSSPVTYRVTVQDLQALRILGRGNARVDRLETDRLALGISGYGKIDINALYASALDGNISGRGELSLKGTVQEQALFVSGSGEYRAKELQSRRASVRVSGHGNLTLAVAERLEVTISGYAHVAYYGDAQVSQSISGSGHIKRAG